MNNIVSVAGLTAITTIFLGGCGYPSSYEAKQACWDWAAEGERVSWVNSVSGPMSASIRECLQDENQFVGLERKSAAGKEYDYDIGSQGWKWKHPAEVVKRFRY